jgi:hypothetical protein
MSVMLYPITITMPQIIDLGYRYPANLLKLGVSVYLILPLQYPLRGRPA